MTTYIHLSSNDSLNVYPDNTASRFKCNLPTAIYIGDSEWELALVSIQGPVPAMFNVFCDVIEQNVVKDRTLPILRQVVNKKSFEQLQFIKVAVPEITAIQLYLTDFELIPINKKGTVTCTLCLRKRGIIF